MHSSKLRHDRAYVFMQAALVWGIKHVDARAWVEEGRISAAWQGTEVSLDAETANKVKEHIEKIEQAGKFVMPD